MFIKIRNNKRKKLKECTICLRSLDARFIKYCDDCRPLAMKIKRNCVYQLQLLRHKQRRKWKTAIVKNAEKN